MLLLAKITIRGQLTDLTAKQTILSSNHYHLVYLLHLTQLRAIHDHFYEHFEKGSARISLRMQKINGSVRG